MDIEKQFASLSIDSVVETSLDETSAAESSLIKIKLKRVLETSKCNHEIEIMKQLNLKRVHI